MFKKNRGLSLIASAIISVMTVLYLSYTLYNFYLSIGERNYEVQVDNMRDVALQGSQAVNTKLEGYMLTLNGLSGLVDPDDIYNQETMSAFADMAKCMGFRSIAVSDLSGNLISTADEHIDISGRDYFDTLMKDGEAISSIEYDVVTGTEVFGVFTTINGRNLEPVGYLCASIPVTGFEVFDAQGISKIKRAVQIIDIDGNYIYKRNYTGLSKNYQDAFTGFERAELDMSVDELAAKMSAGENFHTCVRFGDVPYEAFFVQLSLNGWYYILFTDGNDMHGKVDKILQNDLILLIVKIAAATLILLLILVFLLIRGKSRELKNEKTIRESLLADTDGFIVANLTDNRIIQIKGRIFSAYNEGTSYTEFVEDRIKDISDFEDVVKIKRLMSPDGILEEYRRGVTDLVLDYRCTDEDAGTVWREMYIHADYDEDHEYLAAYCTVRNIDNRKRWELKLREYADVDYLTGLSNRRSGTEQIERYLDSADRKGISAFIILDLDNFKLLNDTFGHHEGDWVLKCVADDLISHFDTHDVVMRLAGDEFVVFVPDTTLDLLRPKMDTLIEKLKRSITKDGKTVILSASAGVALAHAPNTEFMELYRRADAALYEIKNSGKNDYKIIDE